MLHKIEPESLLSQNLPAIIGVFSAIIGVFVGALLNRFFSAGKIKIYVNKIEKKLYSKGSGGGEGETTEIDNACKLILDFNIDLYNSSSDFRIIRNLTLQSEYNDIINDYKLMDFSTKDLHGNTIVINPITYVNVPPKTVKNLQLRLIVRKKEEIEELHNAVEFCLNYCDFKEREQTISLT